MVPLPEIYLTGLQGFLPVLYTWLRSKTKRPSSPVQLAEDDPDLEPLTKPLEDKPEELKGWKVFLLWIPAACDLTGTTVRLWLSYSRELMFNATLLANEYRPSLYPRFYLSNDTGGSGPIRGCIQRNLP